MYEKEIERLEALNATLNQGRGLQHIRSIVIWLQRGEYDLARNVRMIDSDKHYCWPEVEPVMEEIFGCCLHGVKNCKKRFCREYRENHQQRWEEEQERRAHE